MFQKLVMPFVISFVLKQLEKFQGSIDWEIVRADAEKQVRAFVPGTWFDDEAVAFVDRIIVLLRNALGQKDEQKNILKFLADQNYAAAAEELKSLLLAAWAVDDLKSRTVIASFEVLPEV